MYGTFRRKIISETIKLIANPKLAITYLKEFKSFISNPRRVKNCMGIGLLWACVVFSALFLCLFLIMIFKGGASVLSLEFITQYPRDGMTAGGIFPAIVGTFYLTGLSMLFALPLGVLSAIYLTEYAKPEWLVNIIRIAINTLAGVPSVVYGLFGLAVFVIYFKMGVSVLAGSLTLAVLILPIIINTSEEAIKQVPQDFKEASLGLGATKRETIINIILPAALPNILTGAIISVGRAAGETAPIIFTAATFFTGPFLPGLRDECLALPFHIYALMTEGTSEAQTPIAYGTAIVLLVLVLGINLVAIIIRYYLRRNKKW